MMGNKNDAMVDFTPSLIEHLDNIEQFISVAITPECIFKKKSGMLVGRKLNAREARAFGIVVDVLRERAAHLRKRQQKGTK